MPAIRVVLCDPYPIVLSGLAKIFRTTEDITVVGTCRKGTTALALLRHHDPDVLIAASRLGDMSGLALAQAVQEATGRTRIILLSNGLNDDDEVQALRHGVRGITQHGVTPDTLLACVRAVHAGQTCLEASTVHRTLALILRQDAAAAADAQALSPRELTLARLVAQGLSNRAIATQLGITEGTVKLHLSHIYQKLGVANRIGLVLRARDRLLP
ncbi:MAG: Response regulator protein VraR [Gemmatimonadota bacterium]